MKSPTLCSLVILLSVVTCGARPVRCLEMNALVEQSALVFVGTVKSIKPSGIKTELSYVPWEGVVFEWLKVEVEVVEAIKGTKNGAVVNTLVLSTRDTPPMAPGMVYPKVGQQYLLCLLPTTLKGCYASLTAPYDDNEGAFLLDRKSWTNRTTYYKDGKVVTFEQQSEKNALLWNLVEDDGRVNPGSVELMREKFKTEISKPAREGAVIYLKWKKEISPGGWQWDVPDESNGKR